MKIVIVGPNVGLGGVERASSNWANGLYDLGHDVTYLALIPDDKFFNLKCNYIEPDCFNKKKISLLQTFKYVRYHIKKIDPNVIICFTKFYAALVNYYLFGTRHKVLVTERQSPIYIWPKKIEVICKVSFFLKKPKGVISQTSIASEYHQKYYGNTRYTVVPNAVRELTKYPEVKRENIILAVGRFHDACKGFDLLIQAFNLLKNEKWNLVFAGGTREEGQYLLDLATESKKDRIEFLGAVKDMDSLYAKAGIFVMPSRSEGFPNALAEALAAGCCCVSFDFTAGPRDLIVHEVNGEIVEAENVEALAKTLDDLILNENKRSLYSIEAIKVGERLSEHNISKQIMKFISI